MKSISLLRLGFISVFIVMFSSCIKDQCIQTYSYYLPVYKTTAEVRANIKSNAPRKMENTGKIYIYGRYIFLNEMDKGIHIIDNSNPASPQKIAFVDIPGNIDMAVKGNTLYADAFSDLIVLDITNPLQVSLKKIIEGVFPNRIYNNWFVQDTSKVLTDWVRRDTTVQMDCGGGGFFGFSTMKADAIAFNNNSTGGPQSSGNNSPFGMGGSMARFSILNNHLYTVTTADLNVFSITDPVNPVFNKTVPIGWNIETIYPFRDRLFIGSTSGMFIFSVADPNIPVQIGRFEHARSCDPVVADDVNAFITLRSGTECEGFSNQLDIVNVQNPATPAFVKTYGMSNPHGLSKDGDRLLICDGKAGLKIYDASNVQDLRLLYTVTDIETYDVIAWKGIALVVAKGGLYQYDYTNPLAVKLLSKMEIAL